MGVQANVWTEYMPDFSQVQYMIFPRITALAEVAWSRSDIKDFRWFVPRVMAHMKRYDQMHIHYSRAMFEIKPRLLVSPQGNGIMLSLSTYSALGEIKFARNKPEVTWSDSLFTGAIPITANDEIVAAVFDGREKLSPDYRQQFSVNKATGKNVTLCKAPSPAYNNGGSVTLVDGITGRTPWTGSQWLGWWGDTLDATIDLGKTDTIHSIKIHMLKDHGSWIYPSENISFMVSSDGIHYTRPVVELTFTRPTAGSTRAEYYFTARARYIRIIVGNAGPIPAGSPGAGNPSWLFVSEIVVE
jgi:hexosaminidase